MNNFIKLTYYLIMIFSIILLLTTMFLLFPVNVIKKNKILKSEKYLDKYRGLVLFDIDGTLSTGKDNSNVVQACINNGFAVGICTAGRIYTMDNILSYNWMPHNLYKFIRKYDDITFNNVGSGILLGKKNIKAYLELPNYHPGFLKGFAMIETGKALGITNPNCIILCDDQKSYILNVIKYNPYLNVVCCGENCGGNLTVDSVMSAMNKCLKSSY